MQTLRAVSKLKQFVQENEVFHLLIAKFQESEKHE